MRQSCRTSPAGPGRRAFMSLALSWPVGLLAADNVVRPTPLQWAVEDRIELALSRHRSGFHCSQSVLAAYADDLGLPVDLALRMAAGLAGGSTVGGECGAVAAGYLVLGARHGLTVPTGGDVERERELFGRMRRFVGEFKRRHRAINCRELLGVDVFTSEGLAEGRRRGLFAGRCPGYIRDVVAILESLA